MIGELKQDWSFLADPVARTDTLDRYKYLPWGGDAQHYASFGLEYRTEYEYFDSWMFRAGPQDHNGYVMSRVMPHDRPVSLRRPPPGTLKGEHNISKESGKVDVSPIGFLCHRLPPCGALHLNRQNSSYLFPLTL